MRSLFIFLILTLIAQSLFAKKVKLFGQHAAYANTEITILCYDDAFSKTERELAVMYFDAKGQFSVEFDIEATQMIFLPLGVFRGYFFVEPDKTYQLSLPPKRDLAPQQKNDPFFVPQDLMLGARNSGKEDLNNLIRQFDYVFDHFINQNFDRIYNRKSQSVGIRFAEEMRLQYEHIPHAYFQDYLKYRLGFLAYLASPESYLQLENKYFADRELALNNPAYTVLFKKVYNNALGSAFHRRDKSRYNKAVESDNAYDELSLLLMKYPVYKDQSFRDLVLTKSIFDATENALLTRTKAIGILQDIVRKSEDDKIKRLAGNYLAKLSHLIKKSDAPYFQVGGISLTDYRGKYLYLNFCNTSNALWERDFELIKKLKETFGNEVAFLSLASDTDALAFKNRLKQSDLTWPIVHVDSKNSVLNDYNIKVFPTYIIIDPTGKVYQYPARGPLDGIEKTFVKIQREVRFRNPNHKNRRGFLN